MPIIAIVLFKVPKIVFGNFTDAVFYLSYSRQFTELVVRHGFIYYCTRFGGILPDFISGCLFGESDGIFILRWILACAVSLALFIFFRKRYGALAGLIASLLWASNPAALRLTCTTYVDSTSVPFLILGCCIFGFQSAGVVGFLITGVLFGLASSAHLYAAFALVLMIPWLASTGWSDRRRLIKGVIWTTVGFTATWFIAWLWYAWVWKMPALLSPTIEVMSNLAGGQTTFWKKATSVALQDAPAWYAPVVMIPAALVLSFKGSPLVKGATLSLVVSTLFFWGGDLFGSAYVLSMPFYYSFLIPMMTLSPATLAGDFLYRIDGIREKCLSGLLFLTCLATPPILCRWQNLTLAGIIIGIATAALLGLLIKGSPSVRCLRSLIAFTLMMAVCAVATTGMFAQFLGHYSGGDVALLELFKKVKNEIPQALADGRTVCFWYDDNSTEEEGGADLRMLGSFWLHRFGLLTGENDQPIPFLKLKDNDAKTIICSGPEIIVIFDKNQDKINDALNQFLEAQLPYIVSKRTELTTTKNPSLKLAVAILNRSVLVSGNETDAVDLHKIQAIHNGSVAWKNNNPVVTSGKFKFWDFARLKIGHVKKGDCVKINISVLSGFLRCALNGGENAFFKHIEKWPTDTDQNIAFTVTEDMPDAELSFHSMYPKGCITRAVINKVEIQH